MDHPRHAVGYIGHYCAPRFPCTQCAIRSKSIVRSIEHRVENGLKSVTGCFADGFVTLQLSEVWAKTRLLAVY